MHLPSTLIKTIEDTFGERGRLFLRALPGLLDEAAQRWRLSEIRPVTELSYNFVTFARRDGEEVVLKLGVPDRELTSEIQALRLFAGRGTARLLESDSGRGMLLVERLRPGEPLARLDDDAKATRIAAELMLAIRRPVPSEQGLIDLRDWFKAFARLRARHDGDAGRLDADLVDRGEAVFAELLSEDHQRMLIHGDVHHFNVLSSGAGWKAVDPKGVIGPCAYEVGPFLLSPWGFAGVTPDARAQLRERIAVFAEVLGLEQERIRNWGFAHALLSALWSVEDGGDPRPAMEVARILRDL